MPGKPIIPDDITMLRIIQGEAFILPFGDDGFFSHVNFDGPLIEDRPDLGPCWMWTGGLKGGYGYYRIPRTRKNAFAHRYAWQETNGEITGRLLVCHHCDRPACVNPRHLWLGTNMDNSRDKHAKGRAVNPPGLRGDDHYYRQRPEMVRRGEQVPNARLSADDVRYIRANPDGLRRRDLARKFDIAESAITKVTNFTTWKHVE